MSTKKNLTQLPVNAIYLSALTRNGPEILFEEPVIKLPAKEKKELAYKSLPMSVKDGDFVSVSIANFQATCIVSQVPPFKDALDSRDTYVSMGLVLDQDDNPIPYRNILRRILLTCKEHKLLTYDCLRKVSSQLIKSITITHEESFSYEIKKGTKIEFAFLEKLDNWMEKEGRGNNMASNIRNMNFKGVLSLEEALEREKSAFILDKSILKAVYSEGPISIDELRKKTLPLEGVLGVKIDIPMIEAILNRYLKDGLIKAVNK